MTTDCDRDWRSHLGLPSQFMVLVAAGQINDIMGKAKKNPYFVGKFVDNAVALVFPILIAAISACITSLPALCCEYIIAHHLCFSVNPANMEIYP